MLRAGFLIVLLGLLGACARPDVALNDPAVTRLLEAQNATRVEAAANSCALRDDVYPVGAHAYDLAEHFAEEESEITILIAEICMADGLQVMAAAEICGMEEVVELGAFGLYSYHQDFISRVYAEMGEDAGDQFMIASDRCMIEEINSGQSLAGT